MESEKPDIVLTCETWLKPDIFDSEVIPSDFEYEIFRKYRKDGYGGVLIAIKRNLVYEVIPTDNTCELVAVKITYKHNSVIVASMYRPTNNDTEYAAHLTSAIENLVKNRPKDVIWIGGGTNLPDIDWYSNIISDIICSYEREVNETILQAVDNCGLDQVVDFPTRDRNLLDIFLTNRLSLIQTCRPLPGISDHEMVHIDSDVNAKYQRPVQIKN